MSSHTRTIAKKIRYVPMHFSRMYSNFPNLTHNDESLIRRAMVLAKLLLARNTDTSGRAEKRRATQSVADRSDYIRAIHSFHSTCVP